MKRLILLGAAMAVMLGTAQAQTYPAKPIRLVTPFPPAGSLDIVGRAIVSRLNAESNGVLQTAELRAQLAKFGIEPVGGTAKAFADTVRRDVERWSEVIRRGGIKPR